MMKTPATATPTTVPGFPFVCDCDRGLGVPEYDDEEDPALESDTGDDKLGLPLLSNKVGVGGDVEDEIVGGVNSFGEPGVGLFSTGGVEAGVVVAGGESGEGGDWETGGDGGF
ncbi:hypothetical protein TorRG33x02_051950 [Trema orientale]|uniref:Uncharacterized protein n=1 Tax=Trema orientale TaxID=63057 RepID=A0A2P5FMD1_TREOI|nr:hypothetical protein TorRG33x02_051950 [Trema orientale]